MDQKQIYDLILQGMKALSSYYTAPLDEVTSTYGLDIQTLYIGILSAKMFDPDPISIERLRKRNPYNAPAYYRPTLDKLNEDGFLESTPEGGFLLTQQGHILFRRSMSTIYQYLETCKQLSSTEMEELKLLLARLVQAAMLSGDPPGKWTILHSRRLDPGINVASIVKIDQYFTDLIAYRDDAHLATWQHHQVGAHAWDILYRIWNGEAGSFTELRSLIEKRGWTSRETRSALTELINKGWISNTDPYTLTGLGKEIRDESEKTTNVNFFSPWKTLLQTEMLKLEELLEKLLNIVQQ